MKENVCEVDDMEALA